MKPFKILHVLGQRPERTGSGIYLEAIIREAQKQGHSNYWIAGAPAGRDHTPKGMAKVDGAYVYFESETLDFPVTGMSDVMPYNSTLFKDLKGRRLTSYKTAFTQVIQEAVARFSPDVIHTNHLFLLSALARKLIPNVPMVTTCHGTDLRQYNNCKHLRRFVRRHCRNLDRIIALTNDQKMEVSRLLGIPSHKIVVVGGGYDETIFTRAPKSHAGTVHILYAGKFNRSKGVPWLLKSLMKLTHHDWHLHMAGGGSGPEFKDCLQLAEKLGQKVTNHGYVTHRRLSEFMNKAHVQVLLSFFEGLPLVLFEGLASGCRIITTRLSGFSEIFGKASTDTIHLINLPPLETIDRPFKKDEVILENVLCNSILGMIAAVKKSPDFDDPHADNIASSYTWPRVFERILSVYSEAIQQRV